MTLKDWMDQQERKPPWLAKKLDITDWTARRIVAGRRLPDKETMAKIVDFTEGAVTANDFYGIELPTADAA